MNNAREQTPKILLIEDNQADIDLLELALRNAGLEYDLTVMQKGGDALAYIRQQSADRESKAPDLAIVDLNLPQHDGVEILKAMRSSPRFANVPVAIFSSSSLPRERESLEGLRVSRYITKPADLDELLQIGVSLKEMLTKNRSADTDQQPHVEQSI